MKVTLNKELGESFQKTHSSVSDYVESTLHDACGISDDPHGVTSATENNLFAFARLVELLTGKGIINSDELQHITGDDRSITLEKNQGALFQGRVNFEEEIL